MISYILPRELCIVIILIVRNINYSIIVCNINKIIKFPVEYFNDMFININNNLDVFTSKNDILKDIELKS